ncbi:MAG TPA: hypothetical protein VKM93_06745 [Terriglobia bacterium]|nr:hypothetical protein [Terriglobia bacterium]
MKGPEAAERLASEGREESGMAGEWLMATQEVTALPASWCKFERTTMFLRGPGGYGGAGRFHRVGEGMPVRIFRENRGFPPAN